MSECHVRPSGTNIHLPPLAVVQINPIEKEKRKKKTLAYSSIENVLNTNKRNSLTLLSTICRCLYCFENHQFARGHLECIMVIPSKNSIGNLCVREFVEMWNSVAISSLIIIVSEMLHIFGHIEVMRCRKVINVKHLRTFLKDFSEHIKHKLKNST